MLIFNILGLFHNFRLQSRGESAFSEIPINDGFLLDFYKNHNYWVLPRSLKACNFARII